MREYWYNAIPRGGRPPRLRRRGIDSASQDGSQNPPHRAVPRRMQTVVVCRRKYGHADALRPHRSVCSGAQKRDALGAARPDLLRLHAACRLSHWSSQTRRMGRNRRRRHVAQTSTRSRCGSSTWPRPSSGCSAIRSRRTRSTL